MLGGEVMPRQLRKIAIAFLGADLLRMIEHRMLVEDRGDDPRRRHHAPSSIPLMMIALISLVMSRTLVVMQRPTHSHRYGVKPIDSKDDRGEQAYLVLV